MTDTDADDEHDGFVFENDAASQPTGDDAETERSADRRVIGALVVVAVIVLVVFAAVVIPPVASTVTGLFDDGSANVGNTTSDTAVGASTTAGTGEPDSTASTTGNGPAATNATAPVRRTNRSPTPTAPAGPTATTTPTTTATATPTTTTTRTVNETATDSKIETANGTTSPSDRSPRIESFTVTDRSDDGTATLDVEWTVTDPERGLTDVTVRLVTDLDGDARTVERRRFDAGGKETTGDTTFTVPDGSGSVYEVRIEVTDNSGNTAFELTRVVADGDPDESVRGPGRVTERSIISSIEAIVWTFR